jgi:cell division protein ZapA
MKSKMKSTKEELFVKDEAKNRVTVQIFGQNYRLMGEVSADHLEKVAQFVDQKMREVADKNRSLDTAKISVLSAINIADEYFKLQRDYEEVLKLIDERTKG